MFGVSPLAVQFHRTVYLDNVASPGCSLAFLLALSRRYQLAGFIGSALAFGIAVLSKETFLLALPFLAWTMMPERRPVDPPLHARDLGAVLAVVGLSYVVFAAVKGSCCPGPGHTSLIEGITFQLGTRDGSGSIFDTGASSSRPSPSGGTSTRSSSCMGRWSRPSSGCS